MKVFLIATTRFHDSYRDFLRSRKLSWRRTKGTAPSQDLIEFAGRVCYLSFGKNQSSRNNSAYISNLIDKGHESVLEHSNYSILADQISRGLTHQLVRHRAGFSYSQLSQQYHDESDAGYIAPVQLETCGKARITWRRATEAAAKAYQELLRELSASSYCSNLNKKERLRAIRSVARSVLPNATSTTLLMTGNARAWRHLLHVRGSIPGDLEMRQFCVEVLHVLKAETPDVFADFAVKQDELGTFVIKRSDAS